MVWWVSCEKYVVKSLRGRGALCDHDTKKEGATDILARWPTGTTWRVQVKSTEIPNRDPVWPSPEEIRRIKMTATKNEQTPVVAWVYSDRRVKFFSARSEKLIHPTDTRDI